MYLLVKKMAFLFSGVHWHLFRKLGSNVKCSHFAYFSPLSQVKMCVEVSDERERAKWGSVGWFIKYPLIIKFGWNIYILLLMVSTHIFPSAPHIIIIHNFLVKVFHLLFNSINNLSFNLFFTLSEMRRSSRFHAQRNMLFPRGLITGSRKGERERCGDLCHWWWLFFRERERERRKLDKLRQPWKWGGHICKCRLNGRISPTNNHHQIVRDSNSIIQRMRRSRRRMKMMMEASDLQCFFVRKRWRRRKSSSKWLIKEGKFKFIGRWDTNSFHPPPPLFTIFYSFSLPSCL